ncbi:hypothetical protein KAR91_66535 [Candidatus Pacearchaeota archaeon]|nr:hypothetical protein [Candidatus Pacearchaeota archaeon]
MAGLSSKDIQKLDYNTCNQLRFDFRDNVHKYALVYIVFMSAYFAYGKYTLDQFSKNTPVMHSDKVTQVEDGVQNTADQFDTTKHHRFLALFGIGFGVSLSLSCYVGLRMYCRSRSLSVCAIRSQQIMRGKMHGETPLLAGLKVLNHQKYHAAIPHGVSRGEYQTVFLLCILAAVPIFLSYPFFDVFFLSLKGAYWGLAEIYCLLMLGSFLFLCANTAENTFGHLSEADAITNTVRTPILQKKWGNAGRDPGGRIFRKDWQRVFYRGYVFLLILSLFIYWYDPLCEMSVFLYSFISEKFNWMKDCILSCLNSKNYALTTFLFSLFGLLLALLWKTKDIVVKIGKNIKNARFSRKSFYFCVVNYFIFLLILCKNESFVPHLLSIFLAKQAFSDFFANPFLSALMLFGLSFAIMLLVKTALLIRYKIERFNRLSMLLQSKAIYNSAEEYGIYNKEKELSQSYIENFTTDILAYKIFKKSRFTYKECFDYEDCRKDGEFLKKLIEYDDPSEKNQKRLKSFYKIISSVYPRFGRMLYDCWNVEKIKEEFYMSIEKHGSNKDQIAISFPTWLGDCIMARGAVEIVNANFDESVVCVPVLDETQNDILEYDINQSLIIPEMPNTALKHARLKILSNWFKKLMLNQNFICTLDRKSFRAVLFLNRNYNLKKKIQCTTSIFKETKMREDDNSGNKHRVDFMVQFITQNLKKMGYEENTAKLDGKQKYSIGRTLNNNTVNKIGIFPFSSNDNKYKGWSNVETAKLIDWMKGKYKNKIEIVVLESKKHKRQINQIKRIVKTGTVEFCLESPNEFKKLSYVITIDTGSLHLAQLYNIPSAGLYGPTHPHETGPYPNGYKHRIIKTQKNRSNTNVRVDKNVILSKELPAEEVFENVCEHLDELGIL